MIPAALSLALVMQVATMVASPSGRMEVRPPAAWASPLQVEIDRAPAGAIVAVPPGRYTGDIYIDHSIALVGTGRPTLVASGLGSVVIVRAPGVRIEGFDIEANFAGSLDRDSSGIHVAAPHVVIRDVRVTHAYFGIYLLAADDATIDRVSVHGQAGKPPGEQGSGFHLYNSQQFHVTNSDVTDMRDGIYIQSSSRGVVRNNDIRHVRYGLHYMYADDNVFEDNHFEDSAAGAALMFSQRLIFRRNQFLRNRGYASVGLLLKDCTDLLAEDNLIIDNARGLFLDGSNRNTFRRNLIAVSDAALVIYASVSGNVFRDNAFVGNLTPLELVGRRTDTIFDGNYWSDADEPDLDGDGFRDRPYRIVNVFDHFRGRTVASDLLSRGPAARALAAAERAFPVMSMINVTDAHSRVKFPDGVGGGALLTAAPRQRSSIGVLVSLAVLVGAVLAVSRGRREQREMRKAA